MRIPSQTFLISDDNIPLNKVDTCMLIDYAVKASQRLHMNLILLNAISEKMNNENITEAIDDLIQFYRNETCELQQHLDEINDYVKYDNVFNTVMAPYSPSEIRAIADSLDREIKKL